MSLLFALAGHDETATQLAAATIQAAFPAQTHQTWRVWRRPGLLVALLANARTPFSQAESGDQALFLLGDAWAAGAQTRDTAASLLQRPQQLAQRDGYFLALHAAPDGVRAFTDLPGCFPLYHWSYPGGVMLASQPGLIGHHPQQERRLDPVGMAGMLFAGHMLGRHTLWQGVERLPARHSLHVDTQQRVSLQRLAFPFAFGQRDDDAVETALQEIDAALSLAAARACSDAPDALALSLSGGLDSRLLAGYQAEASGHKVTGLTFGRCFDYEASAARRVTRQLGWAHRRLGDHAGEFAAAAQRQVGLECAFNSMANLNWWRGSDVLARTGLPIVTGLLGDAVLGGSHARWGWAPTALSPDMSAAFRELNQQGFPPDMVRRLMGDEDDRHLQQVLDELRELWTQPDIDPSHRSWWLDLQTRQRFHVAPIAQRYAQGSWAWMPFTQLGVFGAVAKLNSRLLAGRQLERTLLQRRFPQLARLPLDRGDHNDSPLLASRREQWRARLRPWMLRKLLARLGVEPRYTLRVLGFNGSNWKAVRRLADNQASGLLVAEAEAALWPAPETVVPNSNEGVTGWMPIKMLAQLRLLAGVRW